MEIPAYAGMTIRVDNSNTAKLISQYKRSITPALKNAELITNHQHLFSWKKTK